MARLWIARDKDGTLALYEERPLNQGEFWYNDSKAVYYDLDCLLFPEVTWENSPQQIELKLCNTDFDRIIEENKDVLQRIKDNGD